MHSLSSSYIHRGGDEPLLGATIPEHFATVAATHGEREAVVSLHQGRRLSYAELAGAVERLARGLLGIGFRKGERIGIWATNNIEWLLLLMATGLDFTTAFSAVAASLNNLGPGLGAVAENYAGVSAGGKLILTFAMLLGRLELFTLLVLFTPAFWRS